MCCVGPSPDARSAPRVLVVEDDRFIREIADYELGEAGFSVSLAPDGFSALSSVRSEMPDAVVLDLRMPGMGGRDVLRQLKAMNPRLPVFIFSVLGDFPEVVSDLGEADGCFPKSADLTPLILALRSALRG